MQSASTRIVLARGAEHEHRSLRRTGIAVIARTVQLGLVPVCVAITARTLSLSSTVPGPAFVFGGLMLIGAVVTFYSWWWGIRRHRANRRLRNLQLVLTPEGVSYESDAGTFAVPWTAVRSMVTRGPIDGIGRRRPFVIVEAIGWGGPVAELGKSPRISVSLKESGMTPHDIRVAVHHLSGGSRAVTHG